MSGKSNYGKEALKAAKDFHYGEDAIKKLKAAKTDEEIRSIMAKARHEHFK